MLKRKNRHTIYSILLFKYACQIIVSLSPCILHLSQTVTYIISGVHRSSHIHQDGKTCKVCTVALNNSIICLIVCPLQSLSRPRPTPKPTCIQSNSSMLWKLSPQQCHKFMLKLQQCYLQPLQSYVSPKSQNTQRGLVSFSPSFWNVWSKAESIPCN